MAITSANIKFFKSTNSLGGAITTTEITDNVLGNLFDSVSGTEARDGDTEYRCFYVKNTHVTDILENAGVLIVSDSTSDDTQIAIALGTANLSNPEQLVANESTAPIGVTFATTEGQTLSIGNMGAGAYKAVWVRRVVTAGAVANASDSTLLRVTGETSA